MRFSLNNSATNRNFGTGSSPFVRARRCAHFEKKNWCQIFFGELFAKFVKKLASVSLKKIKNSNTSNFSPFHPRNEILAQNCHLLIQQQEKVTNNTIWQLEGCFIIQFRILSTMFRFADRLFIKTNVYRNLKPPP